MALSALSTFTHSASGFLAGPTPKGFSTLRVGSLQEPDSLNPFVGVLGASYTVWAHTYELLVGIGPDLTPIPSLAQSWEDSSDHLKWTFHLVRNATWHDGVPFTAEDVNFTFRYIAKADAGNPIGCDLTLLQGYLGAVDIDHIKVLDPYTIQIPTLKPKANILSMFIQILPRHIWSQISCSQAPHVKNQPPIGTGIYKWSTWVRGSYTQLDLYDKYWKLDAAQDYVDQILIIYYQDSTSLFNAFVSGAIDATGALTSKQFLQVPDKVENSPTTNVHKYRQSQIVLGEVGMCVASDQLIKNWGSRGGRNWLVTNLTVRQAFQLAVNRSFLVDNIIAGLGQPGSTIIPPATPFWHYNVSKAEEYGFNPNRARAILNDPKGDGYTLKQGALDPGPSGQNLDPNAANNKDAFIDIDGDGIRDVVDPTNVVAGDYWGTSAQNRPADSKSGGGLTFGIQVINYDTEGSDAVDKMGQWWKDVGISVTKIIVTESRQISTTYACSEDMYVWGWGGDVDPDFLLSVMTTDQILYWQDAWYSNKTYDDDYLLQQTQANLYERQATIWQMQKILYHDAPYLVLWYPYGLSVVRTDKFSGWGDWEAHPGLGLTGFGNDLIMLTLRAGSAPSNNCPAKPIIEGTPPITTFVGSDQTFIGSSSDADADPLTWTWAWDDGTSNRSTTDSNVNSSRATHAWTAAGAYNVSLTVDDTKCVVTSNPFQVFVIPQSAQVGYIVGTVRDAATSQPISGATVIATAGGQSFSQSTDASGAYNLTVPVGTYAVTASKNLYGSKTTSSIVVTRNAAAIANFELNPSRGWITGTVTSASGGAALAGVGVLVSGARQYTGTTNAGGQYNVTVAPGDYTAKASVAGYFNQTKSATVTENAATVVNFVLEPVPQPAVGISALTATAIGAGVLVVVIALAAWAIVRKRRKEEDIQAPMPPSPPPPSAP